MPATFTGSLELRQGMGMLEASSRGSPLMTRPFANPEAFVVRGAFNGSVSPIPQATLAVAAIAQYSASPLMAYEQFGIGNLTIGRGYDPNSYPADRGVAVSTEIQLANAGGTTVAVNSSTRTMVVDMLGADRRILDWNSFDIASDSRIEFNAPNGHAIVLNRIKSRQRGGDHRAAPSCKPSAGCKPHKSP